MAAGSSFLSISAAVAALLAIVIYLKLGSFEGGLNSDKIPTEAVPIWAKPDLSLINKILEYLFPLLVPVGGMVKCPLVPPHDTECMAAARNAVASAGEGQWASLIESTHVETVIMVDDTLQVVLVHPRNISVSMSDAPLILWFHGGGFTVGVAREVYVLSFLNAFLEDTAPVAAKDAVFASVEYRLAPEHPYAAPNDCFRALEYLLLEHKIDDQHLGGGGVHIGGISAGATLAATTALRALKAGLPFDSIMLDEPVFLAPSTVDDGSSLPWYFDSYSHRRNVYTRMTPILWLEWCVQAYSGRQDVSNITDLELTGGVMSASEWKTTSDEQQRQLPPVVLLTAKGDVLHDGGVAFGRVYEEAGGTVQHVDASSSHGLGFMFDKDSTKKIVDAWAHHIQAAVARKG